MKKFMAIFAVALLVAFAAPALADTNPFMDVPAGHWAYDAIAQLAARGVATGYPDGSYKGAQPATRYEMASMIARSLAVMDMSEANQKDIDLLKRLVLEFKNELDALGVKVNDLDKRVAVLEDGIGGWKIRGIFRFDANFASGEVDGNAAYTSTGNDNEFNKERFRLFLTKTLDENTSFYAQYRSSGNYGTNSGRGDQTDGSWTHLYVDTKLPWDIGLRVGRFTVDFEDAYGLYIDDDALFGDFRADGFLLSKSFGMFTATGAVARNIDVFEDVVPNEENTHMAYVLDLNFTPNEKLFLGATGYWVLEDSAVTAGDWDVNTYGFYAGYNFTPAIGLKGIYYMQDLGSDLLATEDSPSAWKAIIDVKQEALKFTSLWIEYSQQDNTFVGLDNRYSIGGVKYASVGDNKPTNNNTTSMWFVSAKQQWNNKLSTFLRYAMADYDTAGYDDATEFGGGVGYQYTPAVYFELAYTQVDFGTGASQTYSDKESVVRFRTTVNF